MVWSVNQARTFAASADFTPVATPTDLITVAGAAAPAVIRVLSLRLITTNTAAGSQKYLLIKRSALDTTGTFVAATAVPFDSNSGASVATVGHYTANPGGLGAAVGTMNTVVAASPVSVPATFAGIVRDAAIELLPIDPTSGLVQPVTLRAAIQNLAVNFNGAALVLGQIHSYTVVWSEE